MPSYLVNHSYSNGREHNYDAGMRIEIDQAEAEWINRDSPGCLSELNLGQDFVASPPVNRMQPDPVGRRDVSTITDSLPEYDASPAAQKLADENGIDLNNVTGTGKDGRIVHGDVVAYIEADSPQDEAQPDAKYAATKSGESY